MSSSPKFLGFDSVPSEACLIVPSRLDFKEMQLLEKRLNRSKIAYLAEESSAFEPEITQHLQGGKVDALAFSLQDPDQETVQEHLKSLIDAGTTLIYLPGNRKSFSGAASQVPGEALKYLADLGLPTLPIYVENPRESRLSFESASSLPTAVFVTEGKVHPQPSAASILQSFHHCSNLAYESRSFLEGSLASALFSGLRKAGSSRSWFDGSDDSELPYDKLLAVAIAFSQVIQKTVSKSRVGIVLPPGKAGTIANLAVIFAGKVPVNLNFSASHEAINSAIEQSGIDRYITADPFVRKMPDFPWPPNRDLIFLERELPKLKKSIKRWYLANKFLPASFIASRLDLDDRRDDDEAVLLFTSGSSGAPKGVVLTHRNLLANVHQFASRLGFPPDSKLLGCLPLFHSFGLTVTLFYPLIEGLNMVSYPSPLDSKRLGDLIEMHRVALLLSTPTFLRGYMRRVAPEKLKCLKVVVTGAEKLPPSLAQSFCDRFGHFPMEGYGLTETSPVTNFNLPDPEGEAHFVARHRPGSVGRFVGGMAVRITNPASEKDLPITESGMIHLKGPNIFQGYLNQPEKTAEVIKDGWFVTGDVGRVDEDGFLYIEGRISRFSKIAGEMVPHEKLEATINEVLQLDGEAERRIAVVGVPDDKKGEAIVLLSTLESRAPQQEVIDLRYKLLDAGIPSLWCPKVIQTVEEIPVLASGKLDIRGCAELAAKQ